jgi:hypothetical protein
LDKNDSDSCVSNDNLLYYLGMCKYIKRSKGEIMKIQKNPFQVIEKSLWDNQELIEKELVPSEHHALECKVVGMQMVNSANVKNSVTGQTEPMIAIVANVVIPIDPRKLNTGLITPDGMSTAFHKACPIAPILRVVLHEEYMSPSYIPEKTEEAEQTPQLNIDDLLKQSGITNE